MLAEYDGSNNLQRKFIYGNYIDEVLLMKADGNDYYYAHDHLYSPAALINSSGTVLERYEYDAYGNCSILEPNFAPDPDGKSDYGNPYYFQGKRLDLLDNGSLELMYWPYRDYSTYVGRWLQSEKLGMIPNDKWQINPFDVLKQHEDGLNLYEAFASNPTMKRDTYGLVSFWPLPPDPKEPSGCCYAIPSWPPKDWASAGYDWWNPRTPSGNIKCVKPCKWRNKEHTDRRFRVYACQNVSGSLPLASGCGGPLAIAGIAWELLPESMKTVEVCNLDVRDAIIGQPCVCRLYLWRKCTRKCCNRWRGVWNQDKKIMKYLRGRGTVQRFLGDGPKKCTCDNSWMVLYMTAAELQKAFDKALDCTKDL